MSEHDLSGLVAAFRRHGRCPTCGNTLGSACSNCGEFLFPEELYCASCGTPASLQELPDRLQDQWEPEELAVLRRIALEKGGRHE
jgi:predicted amidophosphoribosyltransferase